MSPANVFTSIKFASTMKTTFCNFDGMDYLLSYGTVRQNFLEVSQKSFASLTSKAAALWFPWNLSVVSKHPLAIQAQKAFFFSVTDLHVILMTFWPQLLPWLKIWLNNVGFEHGSLRSYVASLPQDAFFSWSPHGQGPDVLSTPSLHIWIYQVCPASSPVI